MKKANRFMSMVLTAAMLLSLNTAYASADTNITDTEENLLEFDNTISDGIFKVTLQGENQCYNDFGEALEAAQNGGKITLQADYSSKQNYIISGNVTLDLNGHTWTVPEYENEPTSISADQIDASGSLDYLSGISIYNSLFYVINGGTFTVNDSSDGNGSIINQNDVMYSITSFYGSTLNINGGNYIMAPRAYRNIRVASIQTYEGDVYVKKGNFDVDMTNCQDSGTIGSGPLFGGLILAVGRGKSVIENCNASYVYIRDNTSAASNFAIKTGNYDEIDFFINTTDSEGFKTSLLSNFSRNGAEVYINNNKLEYSDLNLYCVYGNNYLMTLNNVSVIRSESYVDWSTENEDTLIFNSNIPDYQGDVLPWNDLSEKISKVIFGKECKSVGNNILNGFSDLSAVTITNAETTFSDYAFSGCYNISHIHIPYDSNIYDYCGRWGLPSDHNLYFTLDEDGYCPDANCPMGIGKPHEHDFGSEYNTDSEYHWRQCECGEKTDYSIHQPGAEATEETAQTCTVCGYEIAPALGHIHKNHLTPIDEDPETCTTDGTKAHYRCACGKLFADYQAEEEVSEESLIIPAHHTWSTEWSNDNDYHYHICTVCSEKNDTAPHSYDSGVITTQPTEQTEGEKTYTCSICNYQKTEIIPKLEHTHSYETIWKYDAEKHWHECSCGDKKDHEKHISDGGAVTVKPTETKEGTMTYSCTVCGYVIKTESIPVLEVLPSITYESGSVETAEGLSADFSIKAEGKGLSFCWKKLVNGSFEEIGCTSGSLHIETAVTDEIFICVVTDKNGKTVTSSEMKLDVIPVKDVTTEAVGAMSDEECIRFVNYFCELNVDCFILSDGMMEAVERVLL